MKTEPLTLRRKLALEIARHIENKRVKEHPLRQLFWVTVSVRFFQSMESQVKPIISEVRSPVSNNSTYCL